MAGIYRSFPEQGRALIAVILVLLTICTGATSAHANVITLSHIAGGEQMLADGGWPALCDTGTEQCDVQDADTGDLYGPHHHHHPDCQFSGLITSPDTTARLAAWSPGQVPAYGAVVKPAPVSAADQPPRI